MKIECLPNPKIVITFTHDELKTLVTRIEQLWVFKNESGMYLKKEDQMIHEFLLEVNKYL